MKKQENTTSCLLHSPAAIRAAWAMSAAAGAMLLAGVSASAAPSDAVPSLQSIDQNPQVEACNPQSSEILKIVKLEYAEGATGVRAERFMALDCQALKTLTDRPIDPAWNIGSRLVGSLWDRGARTTDVVDHDGKRLPAVQYFNEDGKLIRQVHYMDGRWVNPSDQIPAAMYFDPETGQVTSALRLGDNRILLKLGNSELDALNEHLGLRVTFTLPESLRANVVQGMTIPAPG